MMANGKNQAPNNYRSKCLCVLQLDVSGPMRKPIAEGRAVQPYQLRI